MMQVRCQRCGWMITLGREAVALALAQAQQDNRRHYTMNCPRCRNAVKIQTSQLRRWLPSNYPVPELTGSEAAAGPESEETTDKAQESPEAQPPNEE